MCQLCSNSSISLFEQVNWKCILKNNWSQYKRQTMSVWSYCNQCTCARQSVSIWLQLHSLLKNHNRTKKHAPNNSSNFGTFLHFTLNFECTISNGVFLAFFMTCFLFRTLLNISKLNCLRLKQYPHLQPNTICWSSWNSKKRNKNKEEAKYFVQNDNRLRWI